MKSLTGAAVLAAALMTAAAGAHDRGQWQSWQDTNPENSAFVPYGDFVGAPVKDRHGHRVGKVENLQLTPASRVADVDVRLTTPRDYDKVVSIPARDIIYMQPSKPLSPDTLQTSLSYRQMRAFPPAENP